jgi:cation diffusion facilitator CzcD-associated flavoprotein CzcO
MCLVGQPFPYGPFVPHWVPKQSIQNYFSQYGLDPNLALNTTVEHMLQIKGKRWRLTLRKHVSNFDEWWQEEFDAVIVANGHYAVPFVGHPIIPMCSPCPL